MNSRPSLAGIVATIFSAGVLVVNVFLDIDEPVWLTGIGLLCLGLAVLFAVPPFFHLKRFGAPEAEDVYFATTRVVDKGVYSLVRHPQYLGYTLLVFGFSCIDPHPVSIGLAVGAAIAFYVQSIAEERFCCGQLEQEYRDYMLRVPRFNFLSGLCRLVFEKKPVRW